MEFIGKTLSSLLTEDRERRLVLPNFQRDFVWSKTQQLELLASFIAGIPVGSILILRGTSRDFASRPLALNTDVSPMSECKYLLDGQQRIATLKTVFSDPYRDVEEWEPVWTDVFNRLQNRWCLNVIPETEEETDLFGWQKLYFDGFPPSLTPSDISPLIEYRRINKTRPNEWHHPAFERESSTTDGVRRLAVGRRAASEGLLPLWDIFWSATSDTPHARSASLHYHALREIAHQRVADLKELTRGSPDGWLPILEQVEPGITDFQADPERIDHAWSNLSAQWILRVHDQLDKLIDHKIPAAELGANQPERAIAIFENINLGGTVLTVFDLIVAKAALGSQGKRSLRRQMVQHLQEKTELSSALINSLPACPATYKTGILGTHDDESPSSVFKNQYLNLLSILGHLPYPETSEIRVEHIKKTKQLALTSEDINAHNLHAVRGVNRAILFVHFRCGVVGLSDVSYELMLLPLSHVLNDDNRWRDARSLAKLEYWFWVSLFGGSYRERQNTRCKEDIKDIWTWLNGEDNPFEGRRDRVLSVEDYSDKETLLFEREEIQPPKAMTRGLQQFILSRTPKDLLPSDQYQSQRLTSWRAAANDPIRQRDGDEEPLSLEAHHLIPLGSATTLGESAKKLRKNKRHILNSPLNVTPISKTANRIISGKPIEDYLKYLDALGVADHFVPATMAEELTDVIDRKPDRKTAVYRQLLAQRYDLIHNAIFQRLEELETVMAP